MRSAAGHFRGRLFRKYAAYFAGLVSVALLISGLTSLHFSYRDTRALVDELQREKAGAAAARIEQYLHTVEAQARGAVLVPRGEEPVVSPEQQYLELLKLLRVAPAVADVAWIDAKGIERLRASRIARDARDASVDRSKEPGFIAAAAGKVWYGPVYFRRDTEPHLSIVVPGSQPQAGAAAVEVNLKFVWDVVATIRFGDSGHAYVVDAQGRLISHPDISRVLSVSDLSGLPQVRAALGGLGGQGAVSQTVLAHDPGGTKTLAAYAPIGAVKWSVLVEQPLSEAFAPLHAAAARSGFVILLGIALSVAVSFFFARRMTAPIRVLESGAQRIGEGHLDEAVNVRSGDELQGLAEQFNVMAVKLRDSYSDLERKIDERTQQLAAANDAKSRFLAAASHDLRQPVHALGLYIAQLEQARNPGAVQRLIEKIAASSAAVSELLDALLDISKLDAGSVAPCVRQFALQPIFDRIEQAFTLAAQSRELRLRVRPTRLCVSTDAVLLERILLNLVSNAVNYTRSGGVLIGARRHADRVSVEVWDTGIGIVKEEQRRIFDEFYRLPGIDDVHSKGTGLGLAIVQRLARLLNLPITLSSVAGRGSKFAISLPFAKVPSLEPVLSHQAVMAAAFDGRTVLLIDDDVSALDAAAGLLEQWGCRVIAATSEREAVDRLAAAQARPDVVVCDYRLGAAATGIEVIEHRRDAGYAGPAVLVSADITAKLREEAATAGLYLLQKPLRAAQFRTLLQHVLSMPENAATRTNTPI